MKSLTFNELAAANISRSAGSFPRIRDWSGAEWLMCLTGEVGELAHEIKRVRRIGSDIEPDSLEQRRIADEAADVAIYLDLLCTRYEINLGEAVRRKFNETSGNVRSTVSL